MSEPASFFSMCPACRQPRLQHGYTRVALITMLQCGDEIDAYCVMCDALWPISAQERLLLARAIAAEQPNASPPAGNDHRSSGRPSH
jgi:hypothetical protein